jgi:hypothetical protein
MQVFFLLKLKVFYAPEKSTAQIRRNLPFVASLGLCLPGDVDWDSRDFMPMAPSL